MHTRIGETAEKAQAKLLGREPDAAVMAQNSALLATGADPDRVGEQVVEAMQTGQSRARAGNVRIVGIRRRRCRSAATSATEASSEHSVVTESRSRPPRGPLPERMLCILAAAVALVAAIRRRTMRSAHRTDEDVTGDPAFD